MTNKFHKECFKKHECKKHLCSLPCLNLEERGCWKILKQYKKIQERT
jgi:hypothetical protein